MLTKLGKYEIKRELGRGAMGIVYEGFDPFIERTVAIKTISKSLIDHSEAQDALNRFRREAQASGRLTHPSIVSIYEYGEEGDVAFIAMEFITGRELKDYFDKSERFSIKDSVNIMMQLLDALEYSHEHGVVHRDIKPSNIIITKGNQIKVVDFGIARLETSELTQVGMVLGTPAYMSPEQFKGLVADRRSDIYSAGVILYQFLTGVRPFIGNPASLMHKVLTQEAVPPSQYNQEVADALNNVVKKAMAKEPDERFQSALEFKRSLCRATGFAVDSSGHMVDTDSTLLAIKTANTTLNTTVPDESTLVLPKTAQGGKQEAPPVEINFDLAALSTSIEKKLQEVHQGELAATGRHAAQPEIDPALMTFQQAQTQEIDDGQAESQSSLLASLARETVQKRAPETSRQTAGQPATNQRLHQTLARIAGFLESFARQVRQVQLPVKRTYNFGRRGVYADLICQDARADSRKQDLSETALLDYVFLSVRLAAPKPVVITRSRDMLDMLKNQLAKIKLRSLDDLDELGKGPKEDWVSVHLAPDFPMQIQFKGNYAKGCIDVQALNVEAFGIVAFTLSLEEVTQELMDGIGMFLLGRTDKLPEALKRISK